MKIPLFFLIIFAGEAKRSTYRQAFVSVFRDSTELELWVGTPAQQVRARLDSDKSGIIVMAMNCRGTLENAYCPRYCRYVLLRDLMGCDPLCAGITNSHGKWPCPRGGHDSKASTTFTDLGTNYSTEFAIPGKTTNRLVGQMSSDVMSIDGSHGFRSGVLVESTRMTFVSGLVTDAWFLTGTAAIVGMAPSTTNPGFIEQLHSRKALEVPQTSLHQTIPRFRGKHAYERVMMSVGVVDKSGCVDWTAVPANEVASDGWKFLMSDVVFGGKRMEGMSSGRITLNQRGFGIPTSIVQDMLNRGDLRPSTTFHSFFEIKKGVDLSIQFKMSGRTFGIPHQAFRLFVGDENKEWQLCDLHPNEDYRFSDESEWTIGTGGLIGLCFGFDYRTNETMIGNRRGGNDFVNDMTDM